MMKILLTDNNKNINNGTTKNSFIGLFTISLALCDFTCIIVFIFHSNPMYDNPNIIANFWEWKQRFRIMKNFAQGHTARTQG